MSDLPKICHGCNLISIQNISPKNLSSKKKKKKKIEAKPQRLVYLTCAWRSMAYSKNEKLRFGSKHHKRKVLRG
jgi:hypothetical protein